jgi:hypothetical protein
MRMVANERVKAGTHLELGPFTGVGRVVAYGQAGDDEISVAGGLALPAELYGGAGADHLIGTGDDDLLIAGTFLAVATEAERRSALLTVGQTWSSGVPYEDRVAALDAFLGARVADDGLGDVLIGAAGRDWFFARLSGANRDQLPGLLEDELVHDLG